MRSLDRPFECLKCFWRYSTIPALKEHKKRYRKICGGQIVAISEHERETIYLESSLPLGDMAPVTKDDALPYIVDDLIRRGRRRCPFQTAHHCRYVHSNPAQLEKHIKKWHDDKYAEVSTDYLFPKHLKKYDHGDPLLRNYELQRHPVRI